jgi:hypothetical protein
MDQAHHPCHPAADVAIPGAFATRVAPPPTPHAHATQLRPVNWLTGKEI